MEQEIINKAKEILASADTGTNDCKIYNDGFLDGVEYAIKALRQPSVVGLGEQLCPDCGNTGRRLPQTLDSPDGLECECGAGA